MTASEESHRRDCADLKEQYDECFRDWYRYGFLRHDFEDPCRGYFYDYNACIKKSLVSRGMGELVDSDNPLFKFGSKN